MEVSRVSTLASPIPDLLASPWQLRQRGIKFPGTIDIDVLHYLVGLFVPLVFKRDTAVYLFSRLSNYWVTKLQRGVLMHPAPGSIQHHSGVGLQCLGPIPADLASPCWPWGSPIHRIFLVKVCDGEMEQLGSSDWNTEHRTARATSKSGEGMVLKTSSKIHSFIHSFPHQALT